MKRIAWIVLVVSLLTIAAASQIKAESVSRFFKYSGSADFECVMEMKNGQVEPKECTVTFE